MQVDAVFNNGTKLYLVIRNVIQVYATTGGRSTEKIDMSTRWSYSFEGGVDTAMADNQTIYFTKGPFFIRANRTTNAAEPIKLVQNSWFQCSNSHYESLQKRWSISDFIGFRTLQMESAPRVADKRISTTIAPLRPSTTKPKLSNKKIALIIIGCLIGVILILTAILWYLRYRKSQQPGNIDILDPKSDVVTIDSDPSNAQPTNPSNVEPTNPSNVEPPIDHDSDGIGEIKSDPSLDTQIPATPVHV